jgi:hypothetical protein
MSTIKISLSSFTQVLLLQFYLHTSADSLPVKNFALLQGSLKYLRLKNIKGVYVVPWDGGSKLQA